MYATQDKNTKSGAAYPLKNLIQDLNLIYIVKQIDLQVRAYCA